MDALQILLARLESQQLGPLFGSEFIGCESVPFPGPFHVVIVLLDCVSVVAPGTSIAANTCMLCLLLCQWVRVCVARRISLIGLTRWKAVSIVIPLLMQFLW